MTKGQHGGARPGAGRPRKEGGAMSRSLYCTERELEACRNFVSFTRALEADRVERSGWDKGFIALKPATFWGLITGGETWSTEEKAAAINDMKSNLLPETWERMQDVFPFLDDDAGENA